MPGLTDEPFMLLLLLIGGHAFADFGAQSLYMANGKNRHIEGGNPHWLSILFAHGAMHGALVGIITGYAVLGFAETLLHMLIDDCKCAGRIGHTMDQLLHYACKLLWAGAAIGLGIYGI